MSVLKVEEALVVALAQHRRPNMLKAGFSGAKFNNKYTIFLVEQQILIIVFDIIYIIHLIFFNLFYIYTCNK